MFRGRGHVGADADVAGDRACGVAHARHRDRDGDAAAVLGAARAVVHVDVAELVMGSHRRTAARSTGPHDFVGAVAEQRSAPWLKSVMIPSGVAGDDHVAGRRTKDGVELQAGRVSSAVTRAADRCCASTSELQMMGPVNRATAPVRAAWFRSSPVIALPVSSGASTNARRSTRRPQPTPAAGAVEAQPHHREDAQRRRSPASRRAGRPPEDRNDDRGRTARKVLHQHADRAPGPRPHDADDGEDAERDERPGRMERLARATSPG